MQYYPQIGQDICVAKKHEVIIQEDMFILFGNGDISRPVYGHDLAVLGKTDLVDGPEDIHLRHDFELDQLDLSSGQLSVHEHGGEVESSRHLFSHGQLRTDHVTDSDLFAVLNRLIDIFRIADPGDGLAHAEMAGNDAGDDVRLIVAGDGDNDVRFLDARFRKQPCVGSIAHQHFHIHLLQSGTGNRVFVDDGYIMILIKLAGHEESDLASPCDQNTHTISSIVRERIIRIWA